MAASREGFVRERASAGLSTAIANGTVRHRAERHTYPRASGQPHSTMRPATRGAQRISARSRGLVFRGTVRRRAERRAHPRRRRSTAQRNALGNAQSVARIHPVPHFGANRNFPNEHPPPLTTTSGTKGNFPHRNAASADDSGSESCGSRRKAACPNRTSLPPKPEGEENGSLTDPARQTLQMRSPKRTGPCTSVTGKRSRRTIFLQFVSPGQTPVFGG